MCRNWVGVVLCDGDAGTFAEFKRRTEEAGSERAWHSKLLFELGGSILGSQTCEIVRINISCSWQEISTHQS
jgi:hypothetical protein